MNIFITKRIPLIRKLKSHRLLSSKDFPAGEHRGEQTRGATIAFFRQRQADNQASPWTKIKSSRDDYKKKDSIKTDTQSPSQYPSTSPSPTRVLNSREKANKKAIKKSTGLVKPSGDGRDQSTSAYINKKKKREEDRDGEDYSGGGLNIPEYILGSLYDDIDIQQLEKSLEDVTSGKDQESDLDIFLADILIKCSKNEDGIYRDVFVSREFKNLRIPKPRSTLELLRTTIPDINQDPNSLGHSLGAASWYVLSQNFYYSEPQCKDFSNKVASLTNQILEKMNQIDKPDL